MSPEQRNQKFIENKIQKIVPQSILKKTQNQTSSNKKIEIDGNLQ